MNAEWKEVSISEIGRIVTGHTPSRKEPKNFGGKYTWIKPTDIEKDARFVNKTEENFSNIAFEKYKKSILPPLATCVVTIGTVGEKICLTKEASFTNQAINAIIPKDGDYDPRFVYYLLKYSLPKVATRNSGTASGRHNVSKSNFSSIRVKVPTYLVQKKISKILSLFDDLSETYERRIAILRNLCELYYIKWFVCFQFPQSKVHECINAPQKIPNDWQLTTLGNISTIKMGQSPDSTYYNGKGDGLPFHQGVTNFSEIYPTTVTFSTSGDRIAEAGEILFSVRAPVGRINIANTKLIMGRGICSIKSKTGSQAFLYEQLKHIFHKEDMIGGGTVFNSVTKSDMHNIKVLCPSEELEIEFEQIAEPIYDQIKTLVDKKQILKNLKDFLLPALILGEIDVSHLEIEDLRG